MFHSSADEREQASPDEDDDDEVRKLKVCIELKGLRLSKPAAGAVSPDGSHFKQERPWPLPRTASPAQAQRERKIRAAEPEDRATAQRNDINRKWGCEKLPNGKNEPPVALTAAFYSASSARVTIFGSHFTFLLSWLSVGDFPRAVRDEMGGAEKTTRGVGWGGLTLRPARQKVWGPQAKVCKPQPLLLFIYLPPPRLIIKCLTGLRQAP